MPMIRDLPRWLDIVNRRRRPAVQKSAAPISVNGARHVEMQKVTDDYTLHLKSQQCNTGQIFRRVARQTM